MLLATLSAAPLVRPGLRARPAVAAAPPGAPARRRRGIRPGAARLAPAPLGRPEGRPRSPFRIAPGRPEPLLRAGPAAAVRGGNAPGGGGLSAYAPAPPG